ncbi:M56 family metallopeptidase [Aquimarina rhabdastrellae]
MWYYLIQVVLFQAVFLMVYEVILKKEKSFHLNRIYLMSALMISFIIPLISIPKFETLIAESSITLPELIINSQNDKVIANQDFGYNIWMIIYGIVAGVVLLRFIRKALVLRKLFSANKNKTNKNKTYKIVDLQNSRKAFSFWKTIFIGDQISEEERTQIILHEEIHIKERHSLDIMGLEMLKIICWFNPLIYAYQKRIVLIHEYIADEHTVNSIDKRQYIQHLLNATFNTQDVQFVNYFFNESLTKNRILMLQKTVQTKAKWKYAITLPMLIGMLIISSCLNEISAQTTEKVEIEEITDIKDIPFAKIDLPPRTEACKESTDSKVIRKCFSKEIQKFVNQNFNTKGVEQYAKPGVNRIYVRFKINKSGDIVEIESRGPSKELENEAKRVISTFPRVIPGEQKGKKVNVLYSLPIAFQVNADKKS